MAWIRLDDQIAHHPKVTKAGNSTWMWVACIAYAQRYGTDGFIDDAWIPSLCSGVAKPRQHIKKLVKVGLLDKVDGGYQVHDYLEFNESRAEAQERKKHLHAVRSEAGKAGNKVRWQIASQTDRNLREPVIALSSPLLLREDLSSKNKQITKEQAPAHKTRGPSRVEAGNGNGNGHQTTKTTDTAEIFITWFHEQYKHDRHGADYLVHRKHDEPIVRFLLKHFPIDRLQKLARILLSDNTDESFIEGSDRGISILKIKANWLNDRLSAWEHRKGALQ